MQNHVKAHKERDAKALIEAEAEDSDSSGYDFELEYIALSSGWEKVLTGVKCTIGTCDVVLSGKVAWNGHMKGDHLDQDLFCQPCERCTSKRQLVLYHRERKCQEEKAKSKPAADRTPPDAADFPSETAIIEYLQQPQSIWMRTFLRIYDLNGQLSQVSPLLFEDG